MSGAMVVLWSPKQAGGSQGDNNPAEHCVPPRCGYRFDADLSDFRNMPPGTPQFIACRRVEAETAHGQDNSWCNISKGR